MRFDRTIPHQDKASTIRAEDKPLLLERLRAFGFIEPNSRGGWRLTECCKAGLASVGNSGSGTKTAVQKPQSAVIRPWRPRTL